MGLLSKITGGGKRPRTIAIEINPTEIKGGELGAMWEKAGTEGARPEVARMLVGGAVESMGEPHKSRVENIELHLSPDAEKWFVVLETKKLTEQEAAEFEAVAAERLSRLGRRLR